MLPLKPDIRGKRVFHELLILAPEEFLWNGAEPNLRKVEVAFHITVYNYGMMLRWLECLRRDRLLHASLFPPLRLAMTITGK